MAANRLFWPVLGALALGGGAMLGLQRYAQTELRIELELLREQRGDVARLRAENQRLGSQQIPDDELTRLRADREALARMRGELDDLRDKLHAGAGQPASGARSGLGESAAPATPIMPVETMRNVGRATPRATGESFIWALQHGDIDLASTMMTFTPEARAGMEKILATLPQAFRAQYGTPERLMAFVMSGSPIIAGFQIIDEAAASSDTSIQRVRVQNRDGSIRQDFVHFQRLADGWRRVISPPTVQKLENFLKAQSLPPPPRPIGSQ